MKRVLLPTVLFAFGCLTASAATCTYSGSWDTTPSAETDEIIITSGDLTWAATLPQTVASWTQSGGTVTFKTGRGDYASSVGNLSDDGSHKYFKVTGNVTLTGGTWTHTANGKITSGLALTEGTGYYRLIVKSGGSITIGADATVSADNKGFYKSGIGYNTSAAGGQGMAHGGESYQAGILLYGYGSVYRPETIGTGNNNGSGYAGGAIRLEAAGTLTVNGTVSADAATAEETYSATGGSVLLFGATIAGSGTVTAKGGDSHYFPAGGGRIAFVETTATDFSKWTGTAKALGGDYRTGTGYATIDANNAGAAGTVYFEPAGHVKSGDLLICGRGQPSWAVADNGMQKWYAFACPQGNARRYRSTILTGRLGETDLTFGKITVTDYGSFGIASNVTVTCDEIVTGESGKDCVTLYGGSLNFTKAATVTNSILRCFGADSEIGFTSAAAQKTLTLETDATFAIDAACDLDGSLVLRAGSKMTHTFINASTTTYHLELDVSGNVTIDEGVVIDAKDRGYYDANAPGYPDASGYAGSHGGLARNVTGAKCYGSIRKPMTAGSGSRAGATNPGGGIVRIKALGDMIHNGVITASNDSIGNNWWHGGAGGSIYISAKTLTGSGTINANGGYGSGTAPGAGGRIALWLTGAGADFSNFNLDNVTAFGGPKAGNKSNAPYAGCGTIYLKKGDDAENGGTLVIKNNGATLPIEEASTYICADVTDTDVGSVVITNAGALKIAAGSSLTLSRDWTNAVNAVGFAAALSSDASIENAAVVFTNANFESHIIGQNTFANLVCNTLGKSLRFGTAAENTLTTVAGKFLIAGGDSPVLLKSTVDGTYWPLEVSGGATVSDAYIADSDASYGNAVAATASEDGGHNVNWSIGGKIVPGAPIEWTGAYADDPTTWTQIANWNPQRVPVETDSVTIPAGRPTPKLADNTVFNSLSVAVGATLNLNGYSLTVTNAFNSSGTLVATGTETLTLSGPSANFLGTTVSLQPFSLTLSGPLVQTVNPGGVTFKNVLINKASGSVSFGDGFSADLLQGDFAAPLTLRFAASRVVSVKELQLDGAQGGSAANLTLASAMSGSAWKLNVGSYSSVTGVRVSDSDASPGRQVFALKPSENLGGNSNWGFGVTGATWTGPAGGCYTNDEHWSAGKAPDLETRVFLSGGASPSLPDGVVGVAHSIVVSGAGNVLSGIKAGLVIADSLTVEGGSLQLDVPTTVTNAVQLRSGATLSHKANGATDVYGVNLTVLGDMTVDSTSKVNAQGRGYQLASGYPGSYYYSKYEGGGYASDQACAHGGRTLRYSNLVRCYGSVFTPTNIGSSTALYGVGGGKVRLVVAGTLTDDGKITANAQDNTFIPGAGGSVWITCGRLVGAGTISADSGITAPSVNGPWSGGGRVAVYQTATSDFSAFTGLISAYGSKTPADGAKRASAAGTVYLHGGDGQGRIVIDNENGVRSEDHFKTDIPVAADMGGDDLWLYRDKVIEVRRSGTIYLMEDLKVHDMELSMGNVTTNLFLNDHTLTIVDHAHRRGRGWTWNADAGTNGLGRVIWLPKPLCIIIR